MPLRRLQYASFPVALAGLIVVGPACHRDTPVGPFAPDTRPLLFSTSRGGNLDIFLMERDGGQVQFVTQNEAADHDADWYPDGYAIKIVFMSDRDGDYDIYELILGGARPIHALTDNGARDGFPRWSPDGTRILFTSNRDGDYELYVMDADGGNQTRLTWSLDEDIGGAWSPDGTHIAFASSRNLNREIYVMAADGSDVVRLTHNNAFEGRRVAWSPDGTQIVFHATLNGNEDIYVINADGTNELRLTDYPGEDRLPVWSPDGRYIGFSSDRDGDDEIYIMNPDGTNPVRLTSSAGLDVLDSWRRLPDAAN